MRCLTGGSSDSALALRMPFCTRSREWASACSATSGWIVACRAGGRASQAARMLRNSVLPPSGGQMRAVRIEHSEGMRLNEESECQK